MGRLEFAYFLLAVLVAGIVAAIAWLRHHSYKRTERRRFRDQAAFYEKLAADREKES